MPSFGPNLTEAAASYRAGLLTYQANSAEVFLKEAADAVRADRSGLTVTTAATSDPVDDVLVDASGRARLIVLGGIDIRPATAVLLGSTTLRLTTHARCPVVAWRGRHTAPTRGPVVVGVDDTPAGRAALATAFDIADRFGVALHAVHSWALRRPPGDVTVPFLINWEGLEELQFCALTDIVDEHHRDHSDVEMKCFLEEAGPAGALLKHLRNAQLVVVGNRGRPALTAAVLGSTRLNMLHHSKIPVIVCHPVPGDT
jgi:nucleotide-binding universal stress UspA family protein